MSIFLAAAAGAIIQEILYWYGKRFEILKAKPKAQSNWISYAIITVLMVVASASGTFIWFEDRHGDILLRDAMLFGAAFPAIFKIGAKSYASSGSATKLGAKSNFTSALKSYFA